MKKLKLCVMLGGVVMLSGCFATVSPNGSVRVAYWDTPSVVIHEPPRRVERRYYPSPKPRYSHKTGKYHPVLAKRGKSSFTEKSFGKGNKKAGFKKREAEKGKKFSHNTKSKKTGKKSFFQEFKKQHNKHAKEGGKKSFGTGGKKIAGKNSGPKDGREQFKQERKKELGKNHQGGRK